jgi:tetratricopeptide (TPR) repeat protein
MVAEGVAAVAARAEQAARQAGTPSALLDGARVLASLSGATGDGEMILQLQRRTLDLATEALRLAPGLAEAHLLAAGALHDLGEDSPRVSRHLERAAALDPHRASLRRRIGFIEARRGRAPEAISHFQVALTAEPASAPVLLDALQSAGLLLNPEELTPETPRARIALGRWYEASGDPEAARRAFDTALALADSSATAAGAGQLAFWTYRQVQAHNVRRRDWSRAAALASARMAGRRFDDPGQEAVMLFDRGVALYRQSRYEGCLPDFSRARALSPDTVHYADYLARTLAALGRHDEAAGVWGEALTLPRRTAGDRDREAPMRISRAQSLSASGARDEALSEIRRILMIDPQNTRARELAQELAYE